MKWITIKFWNAVFEYLNLTEEQSRDAFVLIDKRDKIKDFVDALTEVVGEKSANEIEDIFVSGYQKFADKSEKLSGTRGALYQHGSGGAACGGDDLRSDEVVGGEYAYRFGKLSEPDGEVLLQGTDV